MGGRAGDDEAADKWQLECIETPGEAMEVFDDPSRPIRSRIGPPASISTGTVRSSCFIVLSRLCAYTPGTSLTVSRDWLPFLLSPSRVEVNFPARRAIEAPSSNGQSA